MIWECAQCHGWLSRFSQRSLSALNNWWRYWPRHTLKVMRGPIQPLLVWYTMMTVMIYFIYYNIIAIIELVWMILWSDDIECFCNHVVIYTPCTCWRDRVGGGHPGRNMWGLAFHPSPWNWGYLCKPTKWKPLSKKMPHKPRLAHGSRLNTFNPEPGTCHSRPHHSADHWCRGVPWHTADYTVDWALHAGLE